MDPEKKPHTITGTEARQGRTMNMTRKVLFFGITLVILAFVLAWFFSGGIAPPG
jgi:hypothetical protein